MNTTKILVHKRFKKDNIDPRIYGSFVEHMGRVVYSGIYEPGHATADENGFRQDVMEKTKEMGVTAVRYPGGNFVSNYDWRDGIGPVSQRPKKRELAWKSIETNEVGTDEFMKWIDSTGVEPIFAVNLGTKGIENATSLLEYCNLPAGTFYSDLRCENGHKEPYGIKVWCLGNEMDGEWQIGHKTASEYGRLAHEVGKAMKILDPSIELVACGSSMSTNQTFGEWETTVLDNCYDTIDYLSLHQYYGGQDKGTARFLASSLDMERYIRTVCNICDMIQVKKKSKKQMKICFDEWGVWAISDKEAEKNVEDNPWQIAPAFSEQIYTMEDTLLFASMMMNFLKFSGRVKIACQSLLTNISACIMTEKNGEVWVQPIYYPFAYLSKYASGVVLEERTDGPVYECEEFKEVPYIDHVTVYNEEAGEIVLFLVNRAEENMEINLEMQEFEGISILESVSLYADDKKATNKEQHDRIVPHASDNMSLSGELLKGTMRPLSFQMVRIKIK